MLCKRSSTQLRQTQTDFLLSFLRQIFTKLGRLALNESSGFRLFFFKLQNNQVFFVSRKERKGKSSRWKTDEFTVELMVILESVKEAGFFVCV